MLQLRRFTSREIMPSNDNPSLLNTPAPHGADGAGAISQPAVSDRSVLLAMVAGIVILAGIVFGAFHSIIDAGFLLDDYKHLGPAYGAWTGDYSGILKTFTGNWSGQTDGLTSYRPGTSMSFVIDYMFTGLNAAGYHISNLISYTLTAFLCSVIAFQLTAEPVEQNSRKVRYITALAAGVLFALYPIHAESVAWIIGRVDVLCTIFYMTSVCLYLHSRKSGSRLAYVISLASFMIALVCKEMAVTLPAVIACAEILLAGPLGWQKKSIRGRLISIGSFFLILAAFGIFRTMLLGTVVGGYGTDGIKGYLRSFKNFRDAATFQKILFGFNEEQAIAPQLVKTAMSAWFVCGIALLTRLLQPLSRLRIFAFLLAWLALSVIPTFQIWHIFPNLVGSRLFFLGSAAMCILLAVALVPSFKSIGRIGSFAVFKPLTFSLQAASTAGLVALACCWYLGLQHNLYAWREAGRQMRGMDTQLKNATRSLSEPDSIVLIDIPQDFSGSGMIGRPEYLRLMFTKPVADADYADRIVTLARPVPGPSEYFYPSVLASIYGDKRAVNWFIWSRDARAFTDWKPPVGAKLLALNVTLPVESPKAPKCEWIGKNANLDPLAIGCVEVEFEAPSITENLARCTRLVWRSEKQPKSWIDYSEGPFAEAVSDGSQKLLFLPGRYRSWGLNGAIVDLGIELYPGDYKPAVLKSVRSIPAPSVMPVLNLQVHTATEPTVSKPASLADTILPLVEKGDGVSVSFDASNIESAKTVSLLVLKTDIACPDLPTKILPDDGIVLFKTKIDSTRGTFELPAEALTEGKHQVVVLAQNERGEAAGYTSEPRTFFVDVAAR